MSVSLSSSQSIQANCEEKIMSQMRGVQIIDVTQIPLPPLPPTPPLPIKLSFFDVIWVGFQPIKRVLLYPNPNTHHSFPSLVQILKSSLTATLPDFLPLTGKITYAPSTGDLEIDLSDPSVTLVEAESDLDLHWIAAAKIHDAEAFSKLVPMIDVCVLPCPVFAVQVTRFACGGVAVGYSAHHAVADGKAMWGFIEAWSSACRAAARGETLTECRKPFYDRAAIKHARGEEIAREFIRSISPSLPQTGAPSPASMEEENRHLTRRTFALGAPSIRALKRRAAGSSTFVALAAHAWICFAGSKSFSEDDQVVLVFLMDCRSRVNPPIRDDYFGNCVRLVYATSLAGELAGDNGLATACSAINKSIRDASKDPLGDCENWVADFEALPEGKVCNVSASPRFRVYESDFGWGNPGRVELVSMNYDGEVALVGGEEEGMVQVSVALNSTQMEAFAKSFLLAD